MTTRRFASAMALPFAFLGALSCDTPQPTAAAYPSGTRDAPLEPPLGRLEATFDPATTGNESIHPADPPFLSQPLPPFDPIFARPEPSPRPKVPGDELVTFEFHDTPLNDAIRLVADRAGLSVVFSDDVKGTISASLRGITLDQALDAILTRGNLEIRNHDGVLTVAPQVEPLLASRVYRPKNADISAIEPQLKTILGDNATISVNTASNVILVTAPPDLVRQSDAWMAALDAAAPKEVLIEARILEVSLDEGFEFGVGLDFSDISIDNTTTHLLSNFVRATDNFQVTTLAPKSDFAAVVRAIQSFGRLHVIASPRVLAQNQNEAKIEITEKVPYVDSTATTVGSTTGVSTSSVEQVEFETVGIRLAVTPILGTNDDVTLKIHQDVSEVVDYFKDVPVTDTRLIDTRFVTRNRQTIVIGGLMKERTAKFENGVPWLMDIPLLGWLFSGTNTKREKVELLVFITPTVVEPGSIADVSSEYKRELVRKTREYGQDEYREFLDDVH